MQATKKPFALVVGLTLLIAACANAEAAAPAPTTEPVAGVQTTLSTASATTKAPTTTTSAAPALEETAMPSPFRLVPNEANPVIDKPGEDGGAMLPKVIAVNDELHMWFTQTVDWMTVPSAIYHATSADGLSWDVDPTPALSGDGDGFDAFSVAAGVVVGEGDGWVMYYNARAVPGPGPGPAIGRATSPSLDGPWAADTDPVLSAGESGGWDSGFVTPSTAIRTADGVTMIYSGGTDYASFASTSLGLATSDTGKTFTKLDDPVMSGIDGWDGHYAWEAAVFPYDGGLAALYTGDPKTLTGEAIGYAWSPDGMEWTRANDNPLLTPRQQAWSVLDVVAGSVVETADGRLLLFYSGNLGVQAFLLDFAIGVAELVPVD